MGVANTQYRQGGNIPDDPFIIVIPVNLYSQYVAELHRYLQPNEFDILPYLGTQKTRKAYWSEDVWPRSHQPRHRRIVLSTSTVYLRFSATMRIIADCLIDRHFNQIILRHM